MNSRPNPGPFAPLMLHVSACLAVAACATALIGVPAFAEGEASALTVHTDRASGVQYLQGGAGEGEMESLKSVQAQYPLHIVFSRNGGEYIVPSHVSISSAGKEMLSLNDAGPAVLAKLPPGRYTVAADYLGSTQKKTMDVGRESRRVSWNWGKVDDKR